MKNKLLLLLALVGIQNVFAADGFDDSFIDLGGDLNVFAADGFDDSFIDLGGDLQVLLDDTIARNLELEEQVAALKLRVAELEAIHGGAAMGGGPVVVSSVPPPPPMAAFTGGAPAVKPTGGFLAGITGGVKLNKAKDRVLAPVAVEDDPQAMLAVEIKKRLGGSVGFGNKTNVLQVPLLHEVEALAQELENLVNPTSDKIHALHTKAAPWFKVLSRRDIGDARVQNATDKLQSEFGRRLQDIQDQERADRRAAAVKELESKDGDTDSVGSSGSDGSQQDVTRFGVTLKKTGNK